MKRSISRSSFSLFVAWLFMLGALWLAAAPAGAQLTFVPLHQFVGANPGLRPVGSLVEGSDGNFYGMTNSGGSADNGTVFRTTSSGITTLLVSFTGDVGANPGAYPEGSLVQGSDGDFYGTTTYGGGGASGTVFKVSPSGVLTTLLSFPDMTGTNLGEFPFGGLVQGHDGNFYGTTEEGGLSGDGTVFQITPTGILTTLVNFTGIGGAYPGSMPLSSLTQGSDGNFYGTTETGGSFNEGTVFRVSTSGNLTTLVVFNGDNGMPVNPGMYPEGALVQGGDGSFYGTTRLGGIRGDGAIFKVSSAGILTVLVPFTGTNGAEPEGSLILADDGSFYGTTAHGGSSNKGTVFRITSVGDLTTLVNFTDTNGRFPNAGLTQGSDGNFYGTTPASDSYREGTIFGLFGPPTTHSASETTNENTPVAFAIAFDDPSGKGVTGIAFPAPPAHGKLTVGAIMEPGTTGTAALTYTPDANYVGADSFTYTVTGYVGTSSPQTVTLTTRRAPQTITSFSPTSGPVGTVVTITGTGFSNVTAMRFHDASAPVFSANAAGTRLIVMVPRGAMKGTITVTTPGGSVKTITPFTVN